MVHNSEIFKNEGIQVIDKYISNTVNNENEWSEFISEDINETSQNVSSVQNIETEIRNDTIDNDTDDEWCETTERSSGVMDTLLQEPDITQDGDRILSFAPGEGNRPLGIFMDKDSEFLSFPIPYIVENVKLTTAKDFYPFIIVQRVSGNYEAKTEELLCLCQTFSTN